MAEDVIDILERDHREILGLFEAVSDPDQDRPKVLQQIIRRLAAHLSAEAAVVSPALGDVPGGRDLADRLAHNHGEMERLLTLIERRKPNSPDQPALVTELLETFERHREATGGSLLPALREALDPATRAELGARVAAGEHIIQSHPHPHLLSLGPLSRVMTRVAAAVDRARDRTA